MKRKDEILTIESVELDLKNLTRSLPLFHKKTSNLYGGTVWPEAKLIKLAQSGDREAFNLLTKQCGEQIYRLSFRLTGNSADTEDLWQNAFISAFENISKFKHKCSFTTWLYRITINLWKDKKRREKRREILKHFSLDEVIETENGMLTKEIAYCSQDLTSKLEQDQKNKIVWKTLNKLDTKTRAIIVLHVMENKNYNEISKLVGCSVRTVKSRVSRARELFRQKLSDYSGVKENEM